MNKNILKSFENTHGSRFDYSLIENKEYKARDKVEIICKDHGIFKQQIDVHINGSGCPACHIESTTKTTEEFIKDAVKVHGRKYNYSKVDYINNSEKVEILCSKHGPYFQTPNSHLNGHGCNFCTKFNLEDFIEKSKQSQKIVYDYSSVHYVNARTKVRIICKEHGVFEQEAFSHTKGSVGCFSCNLDIKSSLKKEKTLKTLEEDFNKKHNNRYTYYLETYINKSSKMKMNCKVHGDFEQRPSDHLKGKGCRLCGYVSVYHREAYIARYKDTPCILYLIECSDELETFYKIGITVQTVKKRYSGSKTIPYNFKIIFEYRSDVETIWDLERNIKSLNTNLKYSPNKPFPGSISECFSTFNLKGVPFNVEKL